MKSTIMAFTLFTLLMTPAGYAEESSKVYKLYFPQIKLDKDNLERIEEIHIKVACGHIEAIEKIPDDWNIEIIRAISAVEEFHSSAGHVGSMLTSIDMMNGNLRVKVGERDCFDVTASILTSGPKIQQIELPFSKLILNQDKPIAQREQNTNFLKKTLRNLTLEDPQKDVGRNISNHDLRFIGINGYGCYAPGVEQADQTLAQKQGIKCLDGTSDVIENEEHAKLIQTAIKYAREYNLLLLKKLKSK